MGKLRWAGVAVLAVVMVWVGWITGAPPRVDACDVISTDAFKTNLDWSSGLGKSGEPERQGIDATVCSFGNATRGAQVFEVHKGALGFYKQQLHGGSRKDVVDGAGYQAFMWRDALFLYSQGEYVNVRLNGFAAGSVTKLIPSIVEQLKQ